MNTKIRTLGLISCALALTLLAACAQASDDYVGRWVGMTQGDVFTIKRTGADEYLARTSQGFQIYLTERAGKLAGTVLHVATARGTIRFDHDYSHIVVVLPTGMPQEYKRDTRQ